MDDPTHQRRSAVERARDQLDGANLFLGLIRTDDGMQFMTERRRAVRHCLFAVLNAARSAASVISRTEGELKGVKDSWDWADEARREWPTEDQEFHQALTDLRNLNVHEGKGRPSETIEKVPVWDLPARAPHPVAQGRVFISAAPGTPPPRVGVLRFFLNIDGDEMPAIDAAVRYVALVTRMVGHYESSLPPVALGGGPTE
jgi:hypothetical protein